MKLRKRMAVAIICTLSFLASAGCGSKPEASQQTDAKPSYNDMKTMVVDIMHGKDGAAAMKDVLRRPEFKGSLGMTETDIQASLLKTMSEGQGGGMLLKQMQDPQFATAYVKATKDQNKQLLKELMKDPEYQQLVLTTMKDPDFQKQMVSLLKTSDGRQAIMSVIKDSLKDPTFKEQFGKTIQEAAKTSGKGKGQKGGSGDGGGGSGEGGSGDSGGGGQESSGEG